MRVTIDEICTMARVQLGLPQVPPEARFAEDLGAESADVLNLVAAIEDRFGVIIAEEELPEIRTVEDLFRLVSDRVGAGGD